MTWHRRVRVQVWLARVLAVVFVVGGAVSAAASPGISGGSASTASLAPGARSIPFAGPGSAVGADAQVGSVSSGSSSSPHQPDAATAGYAIVVRPAIATAASLLLTAPTSDACCGLPPARAPPLS